MVQTTSINNIKIPENRIRRVFNEEALASLRDSILDKGLLHPIVLKRNGMLVAGERRLRAVKDIYSMALGIRHQGRLLANNEIPFSFIDDLPEDKIREAELEENTRREDLSPLEKATAIAELHALRTKQNPEQRLKDTGAEILGYQTTGGSTARIVKESILIAENKEIEGVAKAKTHTEARKIVERKLKGDLRASMKGAYISQASPFTLLKGDLNVEMEILKEGDFDLIIADPPYGIEADTLFGDMSQLDHEYADSYQSAMDIAITIFSEGYRITKPDAHIYMFCDIRNWRELALLGSDAGWNIWRVPIIWSKGTAGLSPDPKRGPKRAYECIIYGIKGEKRILADAARDVIDIPSLRNRDHAAQKPVELYAELMRRSCLPEERVLDPCCGSGTIFRAAHLEGLIATGIEKSEEYYLMALEAMQEANP